MEGRRRSLLETTQNTRDLGGYRTADGRFTRRLSLIRSDVQNYPSERDKKFIQTNKITTVIDMRGEEDIKRNPSGFAGDDNFHYYNVPIEEGSGIPASVEAVPGSYMEIAAAAAMPEVFRCIAAAPDGVLFNCTAGKDRTGVVSAILLMHAGVGDKDIVEDYVLTREYIKEQLLLMREKFPEIDMDIVTPCEKYMEEFLRLFRAKYGDTDRYFGMIGLTEAQIRAIREKL